MRTILAFDRARVLPDPAAVLRETGMVAGPVLSERLSAVLRKACDLFARWADPRGVVEEIAPAEFEAVYQGEGRNEPRTPLGDMHTRAHSLALFAVTLGEDVSCAITRSFEVRDFALGAVLDALASAGADTAADLARRSHLEALRKAGLPTDIMQALNYSPGYCGWHITGQKKLFERLRPEEIGITLGESFLMRPLKSVSGVILAADRTVHEFTDDYPFCRDCVDRACRARIASLSPTRKDEERTWKS